MRAAIMAASGTAVEPSYMRGVRHVHAGQLADHRLELEDRRKRALRNLRLVGRVGSQKLAAGNHCVHQHRPIMRVNASAQKRRIAVAHSLPHGIESNRRSRIRICRALTPGALETHILRQVGEQIFSGFDAAAASISRRSNQTSEGSATSFPPPRKLGSPRRRARLSTVGSVQADLHQPGFAMRILVQLFGRRAGLSLTSVTSP